uniref:Kinesin motor domain-containing protein n=1 Tax=Ananas comosus var. bracteatus TaxID=296719 RepID=A0A6V7QEP4_ANACO|nr:unnamed protein product [Ananas comosus var. bracteatus]
MLRDLRFFRRNHGVVPPPEGNNENIPADSSEPSGSVLDLDPSRAPLNTIQEPVQNPNPKLGSDQGTVFRRKGDATTPSKNQIKGSDAHSTFRTPEKPSAAARNRFGWAGKSEIGPNCVDNGDEPSHQGPNQLPPLSRVYGTNTPRTYRTAGKASSIHSDSSSTQSTPTKSVTKPTYSGFSGSRPPIGAGNRMMSFSMASKGIPISSAPPIVVNTPEVPHFELKEDPSFWMDHNVQVVIRVRPLNSTERSLQGYNRCLKQENAQCITWIGQPETRFTFDYVACESVNQEMLFRVAGLPMVENCMSGYNSCMFAYGQEEESRRDEKLKYSCKCSFLEIYNEQITDLLDPSSANLLLREDIRKGVYVENLTEYQVESVNDILKLLIQGSANRKVAATNMNRESSRSHSVFTCVIESRWEKDSTANLRFARLNLVDLAGSERQKTSGAEGERLKEAASINKSLSTLGHVIMILADLANGKQRHVPYRDSRLTFLLQDSLGGNSKTMIIANVSPSICSASETLSTLKFAQRARLIQNNAVVNEDASGDILALQHQIRLLKEELAVLKRQNVSRSLSFRTAIFEDSEGEFCNAFAIEGLPELAQENAEDLWSNESLQSVRVSNKQLKSLEATLAGALRREKMADTTIKQLEAEIEQLNRLVRQREEDTRCTKMMLKFREDKIHRMETLLNGETATDTYLLEENKALSEEIQLLRARVDRNPEVTRFALENIRLLDQLRRFQEFYDEGEREILSNEVSHLRNQLIQILDGRSELDQQPISNSVIQDCRHPQFGCAFSENESLSRELTRTSQELENCRNNLQSCLEINERLTREITDLRTELSNAKTASQDVNINPPYMVLRVAFIFIPKEPRVCEKMALCSHEDTMKQNEEILNLQLELDILKAILAEEKTIRIEAEERASNVDNKLKVANERALQFSRQQEVVECELHNARSVIEALESQHILLINELERLRENTFQNGELLKKHGEPKGHSLKLENEDSPLQVKLKRMQASLDKARTLNLRHQSDQASQTSIEREMEEVRTQVEIETAEVIVCLQEELLTLQQQVDASNTNEMLAKQSLTELENEREVLLEKLNLAEEDNEKLTKLVEERENDIRMLTDECERLAHEIADVLGDGNVALEEASDQIASILESCPQRSWIGEQVGRMIKSISEKDELIEELQKGLEDAQSIRCDLEWKLRSLRGATLAITEAQQQENSDKEKEIRLLRSQLSERECTLSKLEDSIKLKEGISLLFDESIQLNIEKEVLLLYYIQLHNDSENQHHCMKSQLEKNRELISELLKQSQEQEETLALEQLKKKEEDTVLSKIAEDLLKSKRVINELKMRVPQSSMNVMNEQDSGAEDKFDHEFQDDETLKSNLECVPGGSTNCLAENGMKVSYDRGSIILLLRNELESALDNLEAVQAEKVRLLNEKEEQKRSEIQNRARIDCFSAEVIRLMLEITDKEKFFGTRMMQLESKLEIVEKNVVAFKECWHRTKEALELEISDAKAIAAQKTFEASSLLSKIEETHETIRDADIMINALVKANETAKLDIERYQQNETTLHQEKNSLTDEVQILRSSLSRKEQEYEFMEKELQSNFVEIKNLVMDLEDCFMHIKTSLVDKFKLVACDVEYVKSQLEHYTGSARSWLEEIWSEIIGKDCAVSILHLCHMGILLERITGLNAEKNFLQQGLSESNSVIFNLREHNIRSKKELEMCSILKGKLLVDINNSFSRISKKEDETAEFKSRLNSFEKKILNLQLQEELMFARSNSMYNELSVLVKELDDNKRNVLTSVLREKEDLCQRLEKALIINEMFRDSLGREFDLLIYDSYSDSKSKDLLDATCIGSSIDFDIYKNLANYHTELIITNLLVKDIELLVMASEVEEKVAHIHHMAPQIAELQKQRDEFCEEFQKKKREANLCKIDMDVKTSEMHSLHIENEKLTSNLHKLKESHAKITEDLSKKSAQLEEVILSHAEISKELDSKNKVIDTHFKRTNALKSENDSLKQEILTIMGRFDEAFVVLNSIVSNSFGLTQSVDMIVDKIFHSINNHIDQMSDRVHKDLFEQKDLVSNFANELKFIELSVKELNSENYTLRCDLMRKDEVLTGLQFDLSLLQESASVAKDQEEEVEEMAAALESLEIELQAKSSLLEKAISDKLLLEADVQEKSEIKSQLEHIKGLKIAIEEELANKIKVAERLEEELFEMSTLHGQRNCFLEDLQGKLIKLSEERDHLNSEVLMLKENLEMAHALAEENEAIATEAHQIAEVKKAYAEEKEEEIKLLEGSIQELECTVYALENKVDIVKAEAERQRLQREELEVELQEVKQQMLTVPSRNWTHVGADKNDLTRNYEEKNSELLETQQSIQILQKELAEKDAEIANCKAHISELNMHAEAQAREYKQKFKELEAMAQQVKTEATSSGSLNIVSTRTEKSVGKPRGSGSPFKCIGLGLVQQMNSEKDEELTAAKRQIEELEALAASRQKEIFMLNTRLAAAESMTHDVIRDLLGVKLDMTSYASLLDNHQKPKTKDTALFNYEESQGNVEEMVRLKKQLNEFIEERQSWIEEINQKHAEMMAARISAEKLRQREQFLATENEMLKADNVNYKKMIMELEDELKKLSSQQNLQLRIHHHAKTKEENNLLKLQNEELSEKLRRSESILVRVKEELACYRTANGKSPFIDIDEEEQLQKKLEESEEERLKLAQKLLSLCTSCLKVAELTPPAFNNISVSAAEEALNLLKDRITSLENEVHDLKLKCRLSHEKLRLSELGWESSSVCSKVEENRSQSTCGSPQISS